MTAAEWAEQHAEAQGFPAQVTDPGTLARVATILTTSGTSLPAPDGGSR